MLKKFNSQKQGADHLVEEALVKFAMKSKVYDFSTGKTSYVTKNKLIAALNEFSKFYEHMINTDLIQKEKDGQFDYLGLINLLRLYLSKVMMQFPGWSDKDQISLNLIIDRAKKAFFSIKLNRRFISNKKKYVQMNVFERLTSIETMSLKRLFQSIKRFLMTYRGQVFEKTTDDGDLTLILKMPPASKIDTSV